MNEYWLSWRNTRNPTHCSNNRPMAVTNICATRKVFLYWAIAWYSVFFGMYHVHDFLRIRSGYHFETKALGECPTYPQCHWECAKNISSARDTIRKNYQEDASYLVKHISLLIQGEPRSIEFYIAKEERKNNCKMTDERNGNERCFDTICRKISQSAKSTNKKVDFFHRILTSVSRCV